MGLELHHARPLPAVGFSELLQQAAAHPTYGSEAKRVVIGQRPRRIGRWRIESTLGAGGMGTVYLARRGSTLGALKMIHPGFAHDAEFRTRFRREVETARLVDSRYVAAVLDADVAGANPWFVSEYVSGPDLHAHVQTCGPLPAPHLQELADALWQALAAIHSAGVVHRDLKPGNVMLSPRGPVIVDFGIATAAEFTSITSSGAVIGSTSWMAPEQLDGQPATAASDVFAGAATIAYAGTGRPPFGTGTAALRRVAAGDADMDGLPAGLLADLRLALSVEPRDRPVTGALLGAAISPQVSMEPTRLHETPTIAQLVHGSTTTIPVLPQRPRSPLATAAVLTTAVVLSTAAAVGFLHVNESSPPAEGTAITESPRGTTSRAATGETSVTSRKPTATAGPSRRLARRALAAAVAQAELASITGRQQRLDTVDLAAGLSFFDPVSTSFYDANVEERAVVDMTFCGASLRPDASIPHRSASGSDADFGYYREIFAFPSADEAVQYLARAQRLVDSCPGTTSFSPTAWIFYSGPPITGYSSFTAIADPNDGWTGEFWNFTRVGAGVLIQVNGFAYGGNGYLPDAMPQTYRDQTAVEATMLAEQMCVFTLAGC